MKLTMLFSSLVLAAPAFAANPAPPAKCFEQAKQAATALEAIFVAPAFKDQFPNSKVSVGTLKYSVVNEVNRWVFPVTFDIPTTDRMGNPSSVQDKFNVTLAENTAENCYFVQSEGVY